MFDLEIIQILVNMLGVPSGGLLRLVYSFKTNASCAILEENGNDDNFHLIINWPSDARQDD